MGGRGEKHQRKIPIPSPNSGGSRVPGGTGPHLLFRPNWGSQCREQNVFEAWLSPSYLRNWMGGPPYLQIWIHLLCIHTRARTNGHLNSKPIMASTSRLETGATYWWYSSLRTDAFVCCTCAAKEIGDYSWDPARYRLISLTCVLSIFKTLERTYYTFQYSAMTLTLNSTHWFQIFNMAPSKSSPNYNWFLPYMTMPKLILMIN